MKKAMIVLGLAASTMLVGADRPYDAVMKELAAVCTSLKKNLDAKSNDAAQSDAVKLEALFKELCTQWKSRNVDAAVKTSLDGAKASAEVAAALKGGNADGAMAAFKNVTSTCKPCHDTQREKGADGKWKIKGS